MSAPARFDVDRWRSASDLATAAHLTGPFAAGAVEIPLVLDAAGAVHVPPMRLPFLVVALRGSLATDRLQVDLALGGAGGAALPPVTFAPWTESGATLPVHAPPADASTGLASGFTVGVSVVRLPADGGPDQPIPSTSAPDLIEFRLISGNLGRLAYCLTAEQARMRRIGRETRAMRVLATARDDALDRHGADLGVPRLTDRLAFAPPPQPPDEPPPSDHRIITVAEREPDSGYRRRLALYRPLGRTTPGDLARRLNGPGQSPDPNRGPLADIGVKHRFRVVEDDNPFAIAIRLVGDAAARTAFLDYVRRIHLVWPIANAEADAAHGARYLPDTVRQEVEGLRTRLREAFDLQVGDPLAPLLAVSLDRVGGLRRALGSAGAWPLLRAQDEAGGSRYELGLGVDVAPLQAAELEALATAVTQAQAAAPVPDASMAALVASLSPRPPADDPEGRWLFEPCGIRTVHRVAVDRLYLSHLPTFGLVVDEGPGAAPAVIPLEARYHAPGDPGANAALATGLAAAGTAWTGPAWTSIPDAEASALWGTATRSDAAERVFRGAGLPVVTDVAAVATRLGRLPSELIETIRLAPAMATRIGTAASGSAATTELRELVGVLRDAGLSSVLPLWMANGEVLMVLGVVGLPEAGLNLTDRRATGFRWYSVPIEGSGGSLGTVGSRTEFRPTGPSLTAIVTLGYVRGGLSDPFEYRLELPDDALLSLQQYEFLMNLVDRANPIGVEINTFAIRRRHVDLDADGTVDPLDPSAARTFRRFHRPRHRGEAAVTFSSQQGG